MADDQRDEERVRPVPRAAEDHQRVDQAALRPGAGRADRRPGVVPRATPARPPAAPETAPVLATDPTTALCQEVAGRIAGLATGEAPAMPRRRARIAVDGDVCHTRRMAVAVHIVEHPLI